MKDLISELIERLKNADKHFVDGIASGMNIHDFPAYQRQVGNLEGIRRAREILENLLSEDDES